MRKNINSACFSWPILYNRIESYFQWELMNLLMKLWTGFWYYSNILIRNLCLVCPWDEWTVVHIIHSSYCKQAFWMEKFQKQHTVLCAMESFFSVSCTQLDWSAIFWQFTLIPSKMKHIEMETVQCVLLNGIGINWYCTTVIVMC